MKKPLNKHTIINIGFYSGLGIKAVNALVEFIGGFLMIVLSHEWLNRVIRLIAIPELIEDPNDFIMNHLIILGQNLSISSQLVLNSVSFSDGKRYYDNNATYALMRQVSDRLCREYSLSVIENPKRGKSKHYAEWKDEQEGKPTWRGLVREDVDKAVAASMTFTQFIAVLREQGYEVKTGVKYIAVRPPGKERFVRLKTLGDAYIEEAIKQRILQNHTPKRPEVLAEPKRKRPVKGGYNPKKVRKLTGLQALYFHYLYRMGILPKHRASNKRTHFLLREDIRHMEEINSQTRLLCKHRIESKEQLFIYQSTVEQEMSALYADRKALYNKIRWCKDDEQTAAYKEQIAGLSKKLSLLRKKVKLCTGIIVPGR